MSVSLAFQRSVPGQRFEQCQAAIPSTTLSQCGIWRAEGRGEDAGMFWHPHGAWLAQQPHTHLVPQPVHIIAKPGQSMRGWVGCVATPGTLEA